jgi:hypothetical protein
MSTSILVHLYHSILTRLVNVTHHPQCVTAFGVVALHISRKVKVLQGDDPISASKVNVHHLAIVQALARQYQTTTMLSMVIAHCAKLLGLSHIVAHCCYVYSCY